MKIDTTTHATIDEVVKTLKMSRRAVYRALSRSEAEGDDLAVRAFGRTLIPRARFNDLKKRHFPFGSKARSRMAKLWGSKGGTQKAINREKEAAGG
jgi:hypothetical protein